MNCVQRVCVFAMIGFSTVFSSITTIAREDIATNGALTVKQFQWKDHARLSWEDFKGPVSTSHDESAAATCCSIGFKTTAPVDGGKPGLVVYNTFYVNKSWVREDAHLQSILDHEQGHFDLCEIYTRKLRERMSTLDLSSPGIKQQMMDIYAQVSNEYEARQQAYELETTHGTNFAEQRKWQQAIASELMQATLTIG